jgi:hypothetical protein
MRTRNIAFALLLAGSAAFVGFTHAATPATAPTAAGHGAVAMANVSDFDHLQHLREARKLIAEAKAAFDADMPQRGHRKEILEGIDKATDSIDMEIKEYEDAHKK